MMKKTTLVLACVCLLVGSLLVSSTIMPVDSGNKPLAVKGSGVFPMNVTMFSYMPFYSGDFINMTVHVDSLGTPVADVTINVTTNITMSWYQRNGTTWESKPIMPLVFSDMTSLCIDSNQMPHISSSDYSHIFYIQENGNSWVNETVDTSTNGQYSHTSIAADKR